jgi:hypothetical protein
VHVPGVVLTSQASQDPMQALLQQVPSAQNNPPAQSVAAWQPWPCLLLHAPVVSQVPGQAPGPVSSWFLTAVQTPLEHA